MAIDSPDPNERMMEATPEAVLELWFGDDIETPDVVAERAGLWFMGDPTFDELIRKNFEKLPSLGAQSRLDSWRRDARSSLALVLVLDQFPRNLHRGAAACFAHDALAYDVAVASIEQSFDQQLAPLEALFLYLPLEHAEDVESQERCVRLCRSLLQRASVALRPQFESFLDYAIRHRDIVQRFGRFPHRNALLGRPSAREELLFLESGGETFSGAKPAS